MADDEQDDEWFFDILGSDVRRKIIHLLSRGPMSMKQFMDSVNVSRQAILKQLEQMRSKGLVESHDMELEEEEKRKGPPARVYTLTKFFKVEYEVNPSFTEPLVTRLFLLPGDIDGEKEEEDDDAKKAPIDMRECFDDLSRLDAEIQGLQVQHRELYQKKVELHNRLRRHIDDSFEDVEEKEVLLYMLGHPTKALEGFSLPELAAAIPIRKDFLDAVLKNLERQGYIEKTGGFYRIKANK